MKANVSVDFHAAKDLYTEKGASGKNQPQMFHVKQKRIRKIRRMQMLYRKRAGALQKPQYRRM